MDVSLDQGGYSQKLIGAGISTPVTAGKIDLAPGSAMVELALEGTPAQIAAFQTGIEKVLVLSQLNYGIPGEAQGYLMVTLPDATVWGAVVRSGRVSVPGAPTGGRSGGRSPGVRASGVQGLKIELAITDYWESSTVTDLPLSNRYGSNLAAGIQVDNHDDAGHDNWVNIAGAAVLGDVPAPAIVTVTSTTAGLDVMLAGMLNYSASFVGVLEGEAATADGDAAPALTVTADAGGCSGGSYGALTWSGTGQAVLMWSLDGTHAAYFGGRVFRPVLRLRDLVAAGEKIWAYWETANSSGAWNILSLADGLMLPLDSRLVVFPPMALPPWPKPPAGFNWEGFVAVLVFVAEGSGAHAVNADFVGILPCDSWLRFLPVVTGLATSIRYECGSGLITRATTGMVTHVPEGPGLQLYPGISQKVYFAGQAAPQADIAYNITLKIQYKARKRVL
jgi:hypothetical protein